MGRLWRAKRRGRVGFWQGFSLQIGNINRGNYQGTRKTLLAFQGLGLGSVGDRVQYAAARAGGSKD